MRANRLRIPPYVLCFAGAVVSGCSSEDPANLPARAADVTTATTLVDDPAGTQKVQATISRDTWGVPHVYAQDTYSLFYANGYAQAQDRLFAMELLRHVGKGKLASIVGPAGLVSDMTVRRELYTEQERLDAFAALSPEWQEIFQAYADGVTRWIRYVRDENPALLPVEYAAVGITPANWSVTDTIAITQYLLDVFGRGGGGNEVTNAQLLGQLQTTLPNADVAASAFKDLVWVKRSDTFTTIQETSDGDGDGTSSPTWNLPAEYAHDLSTLPDAQKEAIEAAKTAVVVDDSVASLGDAAAMAGFPFRWGSNAQVFSGKYTKSGKPLVFGGPQMGYFAPNVPYEVGIHGAGFDASGMGVTGAPGMIIGRTATQSWTVTSGISDQVDMVAEKLAYPVLEGLEVQSEDLKKYYYRYGDQILEMDCRLEEHLVRPGPVDFIPSSDDPTSAPEPDVVVQEVCRTIHGPVVYRTPDGNYAFASNRSYRGDEVVSGTEWLSLAKTQTADQFRAAVSKLQFTFNFNYANEQGDIMYLHVGRQPLRHTSLDPRLPRPGWDPAYDWSGFLDPASMPAVKNPSSGYLVNWNNAPAPGWPSGDARELWGSVHRAQLMQRELDPLLSRGGITMADVTAANERASKREPFAPAFFGTMRQAASDLGASEAVAALDAWNAAGFDWYDSDGDGYHDHAAFRLFELWRERMQALVFDDELGPHVRKIVWDPPSAEDTHAADHGNHDNKHAILADALGGATSRPWCDDRSTAAVESCASVAKAAMEQALADGSWKQPFPMRKTKFVALGAAPAYEIPMVNRPTYQQFYSWGTSEGPERSRAVLPPGASGLITAADFANMQAGLGEPPHLSDQLGMYERFETKPLLFTSKDVAAHEESKTEIKITPN